MSQLIFNPKHVRVVTDAAKGKVILVHDQGVYLMPDRNQPAGKRIAYARGCDPRLDNDWYDRSRELVGGDDFGEHFTMPSIPKTAKAVVIKLTKTKIAVYHN